jgi:polar amino acid transport system substrate-binding protein
MRIPKALAVFPVVACILAYAPWAGAQTSVLDKVKSSGTLKVCFAQGMPDNFKDPKTGQWTGVMFDLATELTKWMKVKLEPVEVGWDVAVLSLKQGTCDMFGSSIVYNAPRALEINFIRPFGAKGINVVIPKTNPKKLKNAADMNDPKITLIAELGTREHETAARLFPKAKILAVKATSSIQIVDSVKRGDADAAVLPAITVKWWLQVPENAAWGMMGFPNQDFGNAPNGWAVRYGDPAWKDFLDAFSGWVAANNVSVNLYEDYMKRTNPFIKSQ